MEAGSSHLCPAAGRRFRLCSFPTFLYLRRASCGWEHPFGWDRSKRAFEYVAVRRPRAPQLITRAAQLLGETGSHQPVIVRNKELAKFHVAQHQSISKHPIHSFQAWLCSSQKLLINTRLLIGSVGTPACATGQRRPKAQTACWRRGGPGRAVWSPSHWSLRLHTWPRSHLSLTLIASLRNTLCQHIKSIIYDLSFE